MDLTRWPLTLSDNPNASRWVDSSLKYVEVEIHHSSAF